MNDRIRHNFSVFGAGMAMAALAASSLEIGGIGEPRVPHRRLPSRTSDECSAKTLPEHRRRAARRAATRKLIERQASAYPALLAAHHEVIRDGLDPKYLHSHARAMRGLKTAFAARDAQ